MQVWRNWKAAPVLGTGAFGRVGSSPTICTEDVMKLIDIGGDTTGKEMSNAFRVGLSPTILL